MNAKLLGQFFGQNREWRGPCVVVLDAEATIQTSGSDAIVQSGAKVYAPRLISGRVAADFACLLAEDDCLLLVQQHRIRQATGEDLQQDTLFMVDLKHVAAVEFPNLSPLSAWGVSSPR
jgi:hypothetical protein